MNNTTNTPLIDNIGSSNLIGIEWGLANNAMTVVRRIIGQSELVYPFPRGNYLKPTGFHQSMITVGTTSLGYWGGVLAPNGKVYSIPHSATTIIEFDPISKTTTSFGSLSATSTKWAGGVLAPDGKIYCTPRIATTVLEIDPIKRTTVEYTHVGGTYNGAVIGRDGVVYFMPYTTTGGDVMWFDPMTKQMGTFGNVGTNLFNGGVLAPNGNIIAIPYSADVFAVISPENKTVKTVSCAASGGSNSKYGGGVLAPNGKIYCIPFNGQEILVIDPITEQSYNFGSLSSSTGKWQGGFLAPDGYIYGVPYGANDGTTGLKNILKIDWVNETVELIVIPNSLVAAGQGSSFTGAIVTPMGRALLMPMSFDGALVMDFGIPVNENACLSRTENKF